MIPIFISMILFGNVAVTSLLQAGFFFVFFPQQYTNTLGYSTPVSNRENIKSNLVYICMLFAMKLSFFFISCQQSDDIAG